MLQNRLVCESPFSVQMCFYASKPVHCLSVSAEPFPKLLFQTQPLQPLQLAPRLQQGAFPDAFSPQHQTFPDRCHLLAFYLVQQPPDRQTASVWDPAKPPEDARGCPSGAPLTAPSAPPPAPRALPA